MKLFIVLIHQWDFKKLRFLSLLLLPAGWISVLKICIIHPLFRQDHTLPPSPPATRQPCSTEIMATYLSSLLLFLHCVAFRLIWGLGPAKFNNSKNMWYALLYGYSCSNTVFRIYCTLPCDTVINVEAFFHKLLADFLHSCKASKEKNLKKGVINNCFFLYCILSPYL